MAELAKALKATADGKVILRRFRKELRTAADPMRKSVQRAALGLPSEGENARRGKPSLRRSLSRATKTRVRFSKRSAGVVVEVAPKAMPEGQKGLPPYFEGRAPLRHPTFGHEPWVRQAPAPFFYPAIRPHEPGALEAGQRVLSQITKEIESS
jgi:hypothetical protein